MTSTFDDLVRDFKIGLNEGEKPVQKLLFKSYGIITKNVGKDRVGWDLQVERLDGSIIGLDNNTYNERKMLKTFIKKFGSTFEVKRDKTSDKTGNFYWECWSNFRLKNAGCMSECKADTFVFVRKSEFIFVNRAKFLSWIYENLFLRTAPSDTWRAKTFRRGNKKMISARNNPDVLGILIPIEHIKNSPGCFHVEPRISNKGK